MRPLVLLLWLTAPAHALAGGIDDWFPRERLPHDRALEILTPELLGPPAATYDQSTRDGVGASELERAAEAVVMGSDARLAPSDGLRRFADLLLALRRSGGVDELQERFLAEHVGLATSPTLLGVFVTEPTPEKIAEQTNALLAASRKDPDLRSFTVAVQEDDGAAVGLVVAMFGAVTFEPFPRTHAPGTVASIPGASLSAKEAYALWVGYPGAEVRTFELAGDGAFDIEVPLPQEPGAYRVAMAAYRKNALPETPFFFTLYVGTEPPTTLDAPPDAPGDTNDAAAIEAAFVAHVNAERARHGLAELDVVNGSESLRAVIAGMPDGNERALLRYLSGYLSKDPMPTIPHGAWAIVFSGGRGIGAVSWMATENPINRHHLLNPGITAIAVGAQPTDAGHEVLALTLQPALDAAVARDLAWEALSTRWPGEDRQPVAAPELEARLAALATQVAAGETSMDKAMKQVVKLVQKADLVDGAANMHVTVIPAGADVDVADFVPTPTATHLAIGQASGKLGGVDGTTYTVLIIVSADTAR